MTFTVHVEHEIIGGKTELEKFENVLAYNNPPMVDTIQLQFAGERDDKKLNYGEVVRAVDEIKTNND